MGSNGSKRVRGSVWSSDKKNHFTAAVGSYRYNSKDDRYFVLTSKRNGKTRSYESPQAALADGWKIIEAAK